MRFYKYFLYAFIFLILFGCNPENEPDLTTPEFIISSFNPTNDEVKLTWELSKGKDIIIEDLLIYREAQFEDSQQNSFDLIASLPSSSDSFIDTDVTYLPKIKYVVKVNYRLNTDNSSAFLETSSEPQVFSRDFPIFKRVPFQVSKDPIKNNIYHITDKWDNVQLSQYDLNFNQIVKRIDLGKNIFFNDKFIFDHNTIVAADLKGKISFINKDTYIIEKQYNAKIDHDFETFGIIGDRLYFVDDIAFDYIDLVTGQSFKFGAGHGFKYFEVLGNRKLLTLGSSPNNSWASIYEFKSDLDLNEGWDFSLLQTINTSGNNLDGDDIDEFIFTWNNDKSKFITGIEGHFFNINDLSKEVNLGSITGKKYFNFLFHENGDVYASVQKEKKIHVFDGKTLEFKKEIPTKLYPLFILLSDNGLQSLGAYNRVEYWGYNYGQDYGFDSKCAIETF